ncbi:MAG: orotidine-5'-phosphate decarboxylase [Victivallales bacterium]|nr:orotidine-5'-phosphate decarboxylase [Victivallales bacterium]MCF7888614.1 orotidine-5'-phosphate decarboxylase [Victivallales bacterium]
MHLTEKEKLAREKLCLPLDGLNSIDEVKSRLEELYPVAGLFKVGKESYTRFGPLIVEIIHKFGAKVFLDLKYHDIPNTVEGAANAAANLGVYMFNVHASGGSEMMKAAKTGAQKGAGESGNVVPRIIAVTVLTSLDRNIMNNEINIQGTVEKQVFKLANLTCNAGLDGIVCSAADLYALKDQMPENFMYVTPGIKGPNTQAGKDQKRVFTPGNAVKDGADILVVGRAITGHKTAGERIQAGYEVLKDIAKNL